MFALFAFSIIAFASCTKDDDTCTPPALAENIVGEWVVALTNEEVEFKADGTLVDPSDALIGGTIGSVVLDAKTYEVANDSLYLEASSTVNTGSIEVALPVSNHQCDQFSVSVFGISAVLKRK